MKNIKRLFTSFVIVFALTALTSCGGKAEEVDPVMVEQDAVNESAVTEESAEQDDVSSAKTEEQVVTEETDSSDSGDTENEPTGSGNFEDYWISENYFDFTRYMTDNGYWYVANNWQGDKVEDDSSEVSVYYCYDNDYMWEIQYAGDMMIVRYMGGDQNNSIESPCYLARVNDPVHDPHGFEDTIQINEGGKMVDIRALVGLDIVVQTLRNNPQDMDPLSHTDLIYEIQP